MIIAHSNKITRLQKALNKLGFKAEAKNLSSLIKIAFDPDAPGKVISHLKLIKEKIKYIKRVIDAFSREYRHEVGKNILLERNFKEKTEELYPMTNSILGDLEKLDIIISDVAFMSAEFREKAANLSLFLTKTMYRFFGLASTKMYGEKSEIKKITLIHWINQFERMEKEINKFLLRVSDYADVPTGGTFRFDPSEESTVVGLERTEPGVSIPENSEEIIEITEN
jgi:hypothetical protein